MKRLLVIVGLIAFLLIEVGLANAGCVTQQIGNFAYTHCDNGLNGTSQRLGNYTYHHWNDGTSGSSQWIGNYRYDNFFSPPPRPRSFNFDLGDDDEE